MVRPAKDDFVKFSIDGVLLRDVERFDQLAKELFAGNTNPRKRLFYNLLWLARSLRELTACGRFGGEDDDGTD